MQSLHDRIREYQDSHDFSDDETLKILCDAIENHANQQVIEDIVNNVLEGEE